MHGSCFVSRRDTRIARVNVGKVRNRLRATCVLTVSSTYDLNLRNRYVYRSNVLYSKHSTSVITPQSVVNITSRVQGSALVVHQYVHSISIYRNKDLPRKKRHVLCTGLFVYLLL